MNINEFDYDLNQDLIAQTPLSDRSASKLMIVKRDSMDLEHKHFKDIVDYLHKGDVLVLNDTKVIPARLIGEKEDTKAHIELLLLKDLGSDTWECLAKPQKRLHVGTIVSFGEGKLKAQVLEVLDEGIVHVKLLYDGILLEILDELGTMPLPPYIHEQLKDQDRYQTVYAKNLGSAAAPTAGLHFTKELLEKLEDKGIIVKYVTLHVGLGTFRPVMEENVLDHKMHTEFYIMNKDTADALNLAKEEGRRIIAVGTTSCRTLETIAHNNNGKFVACSGNTSIFIYPGYEFKGINGLITNFHLPKSTLVMLVSAFASKDIIMHAYSEAQKLGYRFFSFGDAMFIC